VQTLVLNRLKVLCLKGMALNVQVKACFSLLVVFFTVKYHLKELFMPVLLLQIPQHRPRLYSKSKNS
jgi:hypothetical protein